MTTLEIILALTTLCFFLSTVVCARILYRLGVTMLRVEDTLENSLNVVDERIESMQKILEVPLFSDSPEIKRIHTDMRSCQEALVDIANALTNDMNRESVDQLEAE